MDEVGLCIGERADMMDKVDAECREDVVRMRM
jgi:hypothetical protein